MKLEEGTPLLKWAWISWKEEHEPQSSVLLIGLADSVDQQKNILLQTTIKLVMCGH